MQGTEGAEIVKGVQEKLEKWGAKIVRKVSLVSAPSYEGRDAHAVGGTQGTDENLDAYSAFALPLSADPSSTPSLTKDLLGSSSPPPFSLLLSSPTNLSLEQPIK